MNNIQKLLQQTIPVFISFALFSLAYEINIKNEKPLMFVSAQENTTNLNASLFSYINLGLKRLISSTLWISTILESDIEHYKKKDLNSWMFLRFNSISELEPNFYENYSFGGVYLSIVKDDLDGASVIFNKGLIRYPTNFSLLRDASFHFFFEAKNFNRAYELTQVIKKYYPEKHVLIGMTAKLEAENGRLEDALATLSEYQKNYPVGSFIGDKIFQNRYALKAEIDLECLNKNPKQSCDLFDLKNIPYIKSANGFIAQAEWVPYRRKGFEVKK